MLGIVHDLCFQEDTQHLFLTLFVKTQVKIKVNKRITEQVPTLGCLGQTKGIFPKLSMAEL